ncbi:MAG TPA: sulfotransferase [Nevskia sp.]|nr:sulfotransferase [Nevskia sp.]
MTGQSHAGTIPIENMEAVVAQARRALASGASPESVLRELLVLLLPHPLPRYREAALAFGAAQLHAFAAGILDEALRRWPADLEVRYRLGNALRMSGQVAPAEAMLRGVLKWQPHHSEAARSLAFMLRDAGRPHAAGKVIADLDANEQPPAQITAGYIEFLHQCHQYQRAGELGERALARAPQDPALHLLMGRTAHVLGKFGLARSHFLKAIDCGLPLEAWGGAVLFLANSQRYDTPQHPDFTRFEQMSGNERLSADARAAAGFALGKAYDDLSMHEQAARAWSKANTLATTARTWSSAAWRAFVDEQIGAAWPLPQRAPMQDEPVPVFVVGLPRSGTTLAAELLGRHPQVRNRGELNWIQFIAQTLEQGGGDAHDLQAAAELYLRQLRLDDPPVHWYVDKNPLNFRYLGLISAMFPQARMIHCVRNPRDTALSIWSQFFAHEDNNYAYSLEGVAAFAKGYERLMRHWQQRLSIPVFTLSYERMTAEPAAVLDGLTRFLGLPQVDLLGTSPRADTPIATASVWQARQPIYRTSTERWRAYAPYLPQLEQLFVEGG